MMTPQRENFNALQADIKIAEEQIKITTTQLLEMKKNLQKMEEELKYEEAMFRGQSNCRANIIERWPIQIGRTIPRKLDATMIRKLTKGTEKKYYLENKGTWNDLATLDKSLYHRAVFELYENNDTGASHDGIWHFGMVIFAGQFINTVGYACSTNKRDAESACVSELLHNMLCNEKRQEADIESPSTVTAHSTGLTSALEVPTEENQDETIDTPLGEMTSEEPFVPQQLSNRWIQLRRIAWTPSGLDGQKRIVIRLPLELTKTQATVCDNLLMAQWRLHRLQRTRMVVQVMAPAQKMITGQCFAKFYYEADLDKNIATRYNKFSMSHGRHLDIRAGAKSTGRLVIPFNNRNRMLANQKTAYEGISALNMGVLVITQVAALGASENMTPQVDLSVHITFETELAAKIDGGILPLAQEGEGGLISDVVNSSTMAPIVNTVSDVEKIFNAMKKTKDEDKPMNPFTRTAVIPRYMESMSSGTNTDEQLFSLRLDPKGKKPSVLQRTGSELKGMIRDEALYQQYKWSTEDDVGTLIGHFPIGPIHDPDAYEDVVVNIDGVDTIAKAVPPVDIVASCHGFFSGSLEYKFQPIVGEFHTGALLVAMVPLVEDNIQKPTMEQLNNVRREIFEIGRQTSDMIVTTDFNNLNPVFSTKSGARFSQTPRRSMGHCYIYVQTRLVTSAAPTIVLNVYKRGAPDFEVAEMKNAIMSPVFDAPFLVDPNAIMQNLEEQDNFYFGKDSSIFDGDNDVARYSTLGASVATWNVPGQNYTIAQIAGFEPTVLSASGADEKVGWVSRRGIMTKFSPSPRYYGYRRVILWRFPGFRDSNMVCFPLIEMYRVLENDDWTPIQVTRPSYFEELQAVLSEWQFHYPRQESSDKIRDYLIKMDSDGAYWTNSFIPSTKAGLIDLGQDYLGVPEDLRQEGDSANMVASGSENLKKTLNWGKDIFGEEGGSLTSILRRPQYICSFTYNPATDNQWPSAHATMQLSHWMQPRDYTDPIHFSNRWSTQALLLTGFTFVSGSINRRIKGTQIPGTTMWVNHKFFDKPAESYDIKVHKGSRTAPVWTQSLASEFADLELNSHLNLNFPWKNENMRNLLFNRPGKADLSSQQCYDIGTADIGFECGENMENKNFRFSVYQSFGDDAEVSQYRGFPPMLFNVALEDQIPVGMRQEGLGDMMSTFGSKVLTKSVNFDQKFTELQDAILDKVENKTGQTIDELRQTITKNLNDIKLGMLQEHETSGFNRLRDVMLGETIHFVANPNKASVVATIVNLVVQIGLFTWETCAAIKTALEGLLNQDLANEPALATAHEKKDTAMGQQSDGGDAFERIESFVAILLTGVCSYVGFSHPSLNCLDWKTKLAYAIPGFCATGFSVKRFIHNILPIIKWAFEYVLDLKARFIDDPIAGFMYVNQSFIGMWVAEVSEVCRDSFDISDITNRDRIYLAYNIAVLLEQRVVNCTSRFNAIKDFIKKIREKWEKVETDGFSPAIRKEPFSMWMYGPPGVGKSTAINTIISTLIKENNIEVPHGEMTLVASATSKYLNRIKGQPEMRIDDFMAVNSPDIAAAQIAYVFEVMTSAPYVPNQAAVEKKDSLYAPSFFTVLSNKDQPTGAPITNYAAFLRRRDVTIEVTGDYDALVREYGDEFTEELKAKNGIYGNLQPKMTANFKHLKFAFMKVEEIKAPTPISINGKTSFKYDDFMVILRQMYKRKDTERSASYKQRLTAHYGSRGLQVPDFAELLEKSEIDIQKCLIAWLDKTNGNDSIREGVERLFDATKVETQRAAQVLNSHVTPPNVPYLMRKYYSWQQQGKVGESSGAISKTTAAKAVTPAPESVLYRTDEQIQKEFFGRYNRNLRPQIKQILSSFELVCGDDLLCKDGDSLIPASYVVLKSSSCAHKLSKDPKENMAMFASDCCNSNCFLPAEVREACVGHYYLMVEDNPKMCFRVVEMVKSLGQRMKSWVSYALDSIKRAACYAFNKIRILGMKMWSFFYDHWQISTAIFASALGLIYTFLRNGEEESYIYKIMPDGAIKTKTGHFVDAVRSKARSLAGLGLINQEAYNSKHRIKTVDIRGLQERPQQGDIGDNTIRIVAEAFVPVICEMTSDWHSDVWHTSLFCYGGRKALMTRHEWEIMSSYAKMVHLVMNCVKGESYTIKLDPATLSWTELDHYEGYGQARKGNLGTITLPRNVPQKRSLITKRHSWFQTGSTVNSFVGALVAPTKVSEQGTSNYVFFTNYEHSSRPERTAPMKSKGRDVTTATIYSDNYHYPISKVGYCLAALVDSGSRKIVGFHYAGDGTTGCGERVLSEYLPTDVYEYESMELEPPNESFDQIDGVVLPLGHSKERFQQGSVSKIMPSPIHGCVEVTTTTAQLTASEWSPLYMGVAKHGKPPLNFRPEHVREAAEDMRRMILRAKPILRTTTGKMRSMTTEEAIFGIEGIVNSMDVTTSCGFGWKGKGPGKKGIINLIDRTVDRELTLRVRQMEEKFQQNIIPFVLAVDCLKDETLPIEKVKKPGHTRIISTMPVEYQVLLRKYTMPFIIAYHAYNLETEHAIGISVCGPKEMQFDRLGKMMEGKIVAGDFSNFGPGANALVADECLKTIVHWYKKNGATQEFCATLEAVMQPLICTPHLAYDKVYQTCSGIISGSAITVELNSLIHCMYMRIAALGMGIPLEDFLSEVRMITYGDDGLMRVSDYLIDRFNVETLQKFFMQYGIKYTDVDKSDKVVPYTTLGETSFLKHSFKPYDGQYLAALDKKSIENQINWIAKGGNIKENTVENCHNALRQAYSHGREYYEGLRAILVDALVRAEIYAYLPDFQRARVKRYEVTAVDEMMDNIQALKQQGQICTKRCYCHLNDKDKDYIIACCEADYHSG